MFVSRQVQRLDKNSKYSCTRSLINVWNDSDYKISMAGDGCNLQALGRYMQWNSTGLVIYFYFSSGFISGSCMALGRIQTICGNMFHSKISNQLLDCIKVHEFIRYWNRQFQENILGVLWPRVIPFFVLTMFLFVCSFLKQKFLDKISNHFFLFIWTILAIYSNESAVARVWREENRFVSFRFVAVIIITPHGHDRLFITIYS